MDPHSAWKDADGDATYALEWQINKAALVWEIGGFEGRWAGQMAEKYDCNVDIFEPQGWAVERLQSRFRDNAKVTINPYGLWVMDASLPIYNYETDGASLFEHNTHSEVRAFKDIFGEVDGNIDVCLMNIEGGEFVLLPYMIGYGLMKHFKYFWCQFHTFVPDSRRKMKVIYEQMDETHRVMWDFFPTAVAWERK